MSETASPDHQAPAVTATAWAVVTSLLLPKRGHTEAECEDAIAVEHEADAIRLAVADGATEGIFSRAWAEALVEAGASREAHSHIGGACIEYAAAVARRRFEALLAQRRGALPWYAAQKAEAGAFAALLTLRVAADQSWSAEAVGDVTLFHLREGRLTMAWPLTTADAYTMTPDLIASRHDAPVSVLQTHGTWQPGDVILVVTDALAAFLLARPAALPVLATSRASTWSDYLTEARQASLKNDDIAVVRVVLGSPAVRLTVRTAVRVSMPP